MEMDDDNWVVSASVSKAIGEDLLKRLHGLPRLSSLTLEGVEITDNAVELIGKLKLVCNVRQV